MESSWGRMRFGRSNTLGGRGFEANEEPSAPGPPPSRARPVPPTRVIDREDPPSPSRDRPRSGGGFRREVSKRRGWNVKAQQLPTWDDLYGKEGAPVEAEPTRKQPVRRRSREEWIPTDERQEPWRPPLFRPASKLEEVAPTAAPVAINLQAPETRPVVMPLPVELEQLKFNMALNLTALAVAGIPPLNVYDLTFQELRQWVVDELKLSEECFQQLKLWVYERGVQDIREILDFPRELRKDLAQLATIGADWKVLAEKVSRDGTVKMAFGLPDGHAIESVLMPYEDGRQTTCISTQVGCAMGCVFCATGQMGFKRHLTASEIFEQAARMSARLRAQQKRLSTVVLMGMGEPLANYANTLAAVRRMHEELGISMRKITISTVGLVPAIRRLAQEKLQLTLAISLHAATDEERSALLPANKRYPLKQVMEAARHYFQVTSRRVSFEWTLIAGQNDTPEQAEKLGRLISTGAPGAHVNLIPLNPTKGFGGSPTQRQSMGRFIQILARFGVTATPRVRRGLDIDAGCGQLAERALAEYESSLHTAAEGEDDEELEEEEEGEADS